MNNNRINQKINNRNEPSNRNIKKLQKPKPNKSIQKKFFHKSHSKINQY